MASFLFTVAHKIKSLLTKNQSHPLVHYGVNNVGGVLKSLAGVVSPMRQIIVLSSIILIAGICAAQQKGEAYISQTAIDTLVQKAYYILNSTEEISRAALSKEEAIGQAKKIVQKLKGIAEGDRNKKYILWKTGELESQIYLEENGLLLEKGQKRQKAVNDIISRFNEELAKKRPDFSQLGQLCRQMKPLSASKAKELSASFDDRRKNIGREVVSSIDQAVDRGDFDKAREAACLLRNTNGFSRHIANILWVTSRKGSGARFRRRGGTLYSR